jgi:hypothetical protein
MGEALTDFIKNAGLGTLLHFSVTGILFLVSLGFLLSARTRHQMWWFLGIGILPALSGILAMYSRIEFWTPEGVRSARLGLKPSPPVDGKR